MKRDRNEPWGEISSYIYTIKKLEATIQAERTETKRWLEDTINALRKLEAMMTGVPKTLAQTIRKATEMRLKINYELVSSSEHKSI